MFMQSLNDHSVIRNDHGFILVTCNNRKSEQYDLWHKPINYIFLVQNYSRFVYLKWGNLHFYKKLWIFSSQKRRKLFLIEMCTITICFDNVLLNTYLVLLFIRFIQINNELIYIIKKISEYRKKFYLYQILDLWYSVVHCLNVTIIIIII